jgi:hypothetical protein
MSAGKNERAADRGRDRGPDRRGLGPKGDATTRPNADGMVPFSAVMRQLGFVNVDAYVEEGGRTLLMRVRLDSPTGESATGKSIWYAGTGRGPVDVRWIPGGESVREAGIKLSVQLYRVKPAAKIEARKRTREAMKIAKAMYAKERIDGIAGGIDAASADDDKTEGENA